MFQRLSSEDRLSVIKSFDSSRICLHLYDILLEITDISTDNALLLVQQILKKSSLHENPRLFDFQNLVLVSQAVLYCLGNIQDLCLKFNIVLSDIFLHEYPDVEVLLMLDYDSVLEYTSAALGNLEQLILLKKTALEDNEDVAAIRDLLNGHLQQSQHRLLTIIRQLLNLVQSTSFNFHCIEKIFSTARSTGNLPVCVVFLREPSIFTGLKDADRLSMLFIVMSKMLLHNNTTTHREERSSSFLKSNEKTRFAEFTRLLDLCITPMCSSILMCPKLPRGKISDLPKYECMALQMLGHLLYLWSIKGYSDFKLEGWLENNVIQVLGSRNFPLTNASTRLHVVCYLLQLLLVSRPSSKEIEDILFREHEVDFLVLQGKKLSLALEKSQYDRIKSVHLSTVLISELIIRSLR